MIINLLIFILKYNVTKKKHLDANYVKRIINFQNFSFKIFKVKN